MKQKSLFKFIYKEILPFAIGLTIIIVLKISYLELMKKLDIFQLIVLSFFVMMSVMIILKFIEGILFGIEYPLASKMMKCSLRKQYGLNYCVECPESYKCPTEV